MLNPPKVFHLLKEVSELFKKTSMLVVNSPIEPNTQFDQNLESLLIDSDRH